MRDTCGDRGSWILMNRESLAVITVERSSSCSGWLVSVLLVPRICGDVKANQCTPKHLPEAAQRWTHFKLSDGDAERLTHLQTLPYGSSLRVENSQKMQN